MCCYIYSLNISWIFNKYLWYAKNAQSTQQMSDISWNQPKLQRGKGINWLLRDESWPPGGGISGKDKVHIQKQWPGRANDTWSCWNGACGYSSALTSFRAWVWRKHLHPCPPTHNLCVCLTLFTILQTQLWCPFFREVFPVSPAPSYSL